MIEKIKSTDYNFEWVIYKQSPNELRIQPSFVADAHRASFWADFSLDNLSVASLVL